jgi:L,D-peptidoglycan transpeptidase YkuD (ErfK/YbiS/YcfS/YnhG family)
MTARLGSDGVRPLELRRSGDGTTPAGVFPLGRMTAWDGQVFSVFGNSPDPGVSAGPYRKVRDGDCFGATPNHPDYGHLVFRDPANCPGPDDEYLPAITGAYEHAALIGANMEPDVSGDAPGEIPYASAIFLHRVSYDSAGATKPTSGCVSLRHADLVSVLRALRPGVLFAIGETNWLLAAA